MEEKIDYTSAYSVFNTAVRIGDHFVVKEEMRVRVNDTTKNCEVYIDTICCVVSIDSMYDGMSGEWIKFSFICDDIKQIGVMNSKSYAASKCSTYLRDLNLDKLI